MDSDVISVNGKEIPRNSRITIDLPVARLYTHSQVAMPVQVIRGKKAGPALFVSAALHGDELNGVEIIRRLLKLPALKRLRGTLFAIPIVNVYGFIQQSRYLPDRRDLNRSFPGTERGSLAARLAHQFMTEIVEQSTHGIDLHTGAIHRSNLPQIRANIDEPQTAELAQVFGVPVILNADLRDNSLREAAAENGIPMLLYEAGEALRFDEVSIRAGLRGIINVMRHLEMLPASRRKAKREHKPLYARSSSWVRAPAGGILRTMVPLGASVDKSELLAILSDPFGEKEIEILAPCDGIVIGRTNLPLANEGDALFHIARYRKLETVTARVEEFTEEHQPEPGMPPESEPPIV